MEQIKVKILSGGVRAREVNPFGEKRPEVFINDGLKFISNRNLKIWEEAQNNLRTFEIENFKGIYDDGNIDYQDAVAYYKFGQIVDAQIISDNKIRII